MKKLSVLLVFLVSASLYANQTSPSPFWYSLSEKILAGTHQLLSPDDTPAPKVNTKVKAKTKCTGTTTKAPLKCQPKQEKNILPTPLFKISASGVWSDTE